HTEAIFLHDKLCPWQIRARIQPLGSSRFPISPREKVGHLLRSRRLLEHFASSRDLPPWRVHRIPAAKPTCSRTEKSALSACCRHRRCRPRLALELPIPCRQENLDLLLRPRCRRIQRSPFSRFLLDR